MRIVALETSGRLGSVATLRGEGHDVQLLGQTMLPSRQRTAQSLAPALKNLLADAEWAPGSIDLVAVTVGPGSFTGLRIGVTTAKTLAYAVGADIVGVNTLMVLAQQAPPSASPLWTIMDAQRGELFAARFEASADGGCTMTRDASIIAQDNWLAELHAGDCVTGPALHRLLPRLPAGVTAVPDALWQPTAAAVGLIAWRAYRAGHRDEVWSLLPQYYRPSAAEEKAQHRADPSST